MKSQIRQVLFLAIFGFLCTAFVFFVPWGESPAESGEIDNNEQNAQDQNADYSS